MSARFPAAALTACAEALLTAAGLDAAMSADVAEVLVEGDLLGHDTHGLALLPAYLGELDKGGMARSGRWHVIRERGASATWDGCRLPGPWLVLRAIERASAMAREQGTGTVTIRRSHHIACLAAYLRRATDAGLVLLLSSSDPNGASIAPHGGTRAVFTPNPLAAGFPTAGEPVLIDISASLTTNGMTSRLHKQGRRLEHEWLLDGAGSPSDDPAVLFAEPPGTILPLGGLDAGHKGYGLALLVEMLTGGLAGFGRADPKEGWGATVFVQVLDPEAFGGGDDFRRQMQTVADACHASPPRPGAATVRLPGERGLARRREQLDRGVALDAAILAALAPWGPRFGVGLPT